MTNYDCNTNYTMQELLKKTNKKDEILKPTVTYNKT